MTKQLLIITPASMSSKDKEKLTKSGFVVVEHAEPDKVKIITPIDCANADVMLSAAIRALDDDFEHKKKFIKYLAQSFTKDEENG